MKHMKLLFSALLSIASVTSTPLMDVPPSYNRSQQSVSDFVFTPDADHMSINVSITTDLPRPKRGDDCCGSRSRREDGHPCCVADNQKPSCVEEALAKCCGSLHSDTVKNKRNSNYDGYNVTALVHKRNATSTANETLNERYQRSPLNANTSALPGNLTRLLRDVHEVSQHEKNKACCGVEHPSDETIKTKRSTKNCCGSLNNDSTVSVTKRETCCGSLNDEVNSTVAVTKRETCCVSLENEVNSTLSVAKRETCCGSLNNSTVGVTKRETCCGSLDNSTVGVTKRETCCGSLDNSTVGVTKRETCCGSLNNQDNSTFGVTKRETCCGSLNDEGNSNVVVTKRETCCGHEVEDSKCCGTHMGTADISRNKRCDNQTSVEHNSHF